MNKYLENMGEDEFTSIKLAACDVVRHTMQERYAYSDRDYEMLEKIVLEEPDFILEKVFACIDGEYACRKLNPMPNQYAEVKELAIRSPALDVGNWMELVPVVIAVITLILKRFNR